MMRKNPWKMKYEAVRAEFKKLTVQARVDLAEISARDRRINIIRGMLGLDACQLPPHLAEQSDAEIHSDAQIHTAILKLRESPPRVELSTECTHAEALTRLPRVAARRRLGESRTGTTRRFEIPVPDEEPLKIYVTVNTYDDQTPGEIFVRAAKVGTLAHGALDALAIVISIALQYGVPVEAITGKLVGMRFEPSGMTGDKHYPTAHSIVDLIARWLRDQFGPKDE